MLLIDLIQEMHGYDYFRSEDPVESARVVVSDEVTLLWSRILDRFGFAEFARSAVPQLIRVGVRVRVDPDGLRP